MNTNDVLEQIDSKMIGLIESMERFKPVLVGLDERSGSKYYTDLQYKNLYH